MFTEPLPSTLDARKAAVRGVSVSGNLALPKMERISTLLASTEGSVEAECVFSKDEENRSVIDISVRATVEITCQRCLEPMPLELVAENRLALVADDDEAKALPERLEPLLLEDENCDLWSLVEDEIILKLPIVGYHDTAACKQTLEEYKAPPPEAGSGKENPFAVLEQLKSGNQNQE
ncbi:hypothetical protein EYC98_10945 [Halieaceae bacterium IMCC14734]|uniref:Large ribosomal RNA subunit accumulation protein YceD n=1 Tax=Candidatus Litorirhabdus singularis TaxID=2518993 RepID=A0ABT3TGG9_9GAMM|nr:hypothetical protein [Candidatus Litorirhabdus singularis]